MIRKDRFADTVVSPGAVAPHRKAQLFSHFRTERLNTIVKENVNLNIKKILAREASR